MKQKIYIIPGLGSDHRIFEGYQFPGMDVEYLPWFEPLKKESFTAYAKRMIQDKIQTDQKIILIGHSLGGLLSQEIAALIPIEKIILISSIKDQKENPLQFTILAPLYIHKLFTKKLVEKTIPIFGKYHGQETPEKQKLVIDMANVLSNHYLQWALYSLSIWKTVLVPSRTSIFHIHGDQDGTFPFSKIKNPDEIIKNGTHFMVYNKRDIINPMLLHYINV